MPFQTVAQRDPGNGVQGENGKCGRARSQHANLRQPTSFFFKGIAQKRGRGRTVPRASAFSDDPHEPSSARCIAGAAGRWTVSGLCPV
jgi:hypothetical protein